MYGLMPNSKGIWYLAAFEDFSLPDLTEVIQEL